MGVLYPTVILQVLRGRRGVQRAAQGPGAAAELPLRRGAAGDDAHGAAVAVAWIFDGGSGT